METRLHLSALLDLFSSCATRESAQPVVGAKQTRTATSPSAGPGRRAALGALVAVFLAHLTITLLVAARHEPWLDEADVWLFARDTAAVDWWTYLRHSGHPGLWHLLVTGLTKAGLPYASMTWLNVAIVAIGVAIFLRWARLPLPLKLLIPFGVLPLFEYGVIARSYGLSFTLSMAACALLASGRARPIWTGVILALLANTNAHSLIVAAAFGLYWIFDRLRQHASIAERFPLRVWSGMAIAALGGLASAAQMLPPADPQWPTDVWRAERVLTHVLTEAYFPRFGRSLGGALGVVLLALFVPLLIRRRASLVFCIASLGGLSLLFLYAHPPSRRHAGFFWIVTICLLWFDGSGPLLVSRWRSRFHWAFAVSLIVAVVEGVRLSALDFRRPFSASHEAAELLDDLDLESAVVAAHPSWATESILPYLPIRAFYYPGIAQMGSHCHWNAAHSAGEKVDEAVALTLSRRAFPEPQPLIFVTNKLLERPEESGLTLWKRTATPPREFKVKEQYFIYISSTVRELDKR